MKEIRVEWCKNFIKSFFEKHDIFDGGVEAGCFWDAAERSGLWVRGTYGTPMSQALAELTVVESVHDADGNFLYHVFRLA